ncbi:MAG: D-glycerate dehydrogenase [Thermoleophilia bacterium]|nr:D-glycerate dehydrogenase [Thermoleophilia bacterium]
MPAPPRARVVATRRLPAPVVSELRASFELVLHDRVEAPPRDDVLASAAGADALLTVPTDRVDAELLDAAGGRLRVIAQYGVGHDNVDLAAATARGVVVTNTPDVLTGATAELTIALLLALARRVAEGDRLVRRGDPWSLSPTFLLGTGLAGRTLGVVGWGRIGREVGRLAAAHGMRVVHASRSSGIPLDRLLADADAVSLHTPLTPETRHLLGEEALARMRPGALLVNTSRGAVVDEQALVRALLAGRLAGAALDVFEDEPDVHPELRRLENVVLTPHIASATHEAREAMGMLCVEALRDALFERTVPRHALNPVAWSRADA